MTTSNIKIFDLSPKDFQKYSKQYVALRKSVFHPKSDILIGNLLHLHTIYESLDHTILSDIITNFVKERIVHVNLIPVKSSYHVLYKIETTHQKFVVKINILNEYYRDLSFYIERYMQELLEKKDLPYAKIYYIDISRRKYPFDFMIMDYIEGLNLQEEKLEKKEVLYKKLGRIFKEVHRIPVKGAGLLDVVSMGRHSYLKGMNLDWIDFLYKNVENHITKVFEIGLLDEVKSKKIKNIFLEKREIFRDLSLSLLHNDPSTRNTIAREGDIVALLDWEDAVIGDPLWEIAFVHTFLFTKKDQPYFESFCLGYGMSIEQVSQSLRYWLYYLRIALLKAVSRNMFGYYNALGREIDQQRIDYAIENISKYT